MATGGRLDLALSYFAGTARDPVFLPDITGSDSRAGVQSAQAAPELRPLYDQIQQFGIELQITTETLIGKLEYINVNAEQQPNYQALSAGFEYPFVGVFNSSLDIDLVVEYMWDSRGRGAPTPFENDWALGSRLSFNDTRDTSVLIGVIYSPDKRSRFYSMEASTRLSSRWRLAIEARFAQGIPDNTPGDALNQDGFAEIELRRYF